ncbi:unnamed protein product, partial [Rotaria magnacalcarata]
STTLNSRRNFHSTNNKRILKRGVAHAIQQRDQSNNENIYHLNNDDTRFKFRSEDFPSLPINLKQESDQPVVQSLTPTNTK